MGFFCATGKIARNLFERLNLMFEFLKFRWNLDVKPAEKLLSKMTCEPTEAIEEGQVKVSYPSINFLHQVLKMPQVPPLSHILTFNY